MSWRRREYLFWLFTISSWVSSPQRLCEELEYSELLDAAAACPDAAERAALVASFAVSAYASAAHRAASKPFNPLLGETYECVRHDRGFSFVGEQVSHHPPVSACHAASPRWLFWQEARIKTRFWGKSMEFQPAGRVHVRLATTGDHYSWNKVTTCVHNLFGGQRWVDQYGDMHIVCHGTDVSCKLNFIKVCRPNTARPPHRAGRAMSEAYSSILHLMTLVMYLARRRRGPAVATRCAGRCRAGAGGSAYRVAGPRPCTQASPRPLAACGGRARCPPTTRPTTGSRGSRPNSTRWSPAWRTCCLTRTPGSGQGQSSLVFRVNFKFTPDTLSYTLSVLSPCSVCVVQTGPARARRRRRGEGGAAQARAGAGAAGPPQGAARTRARLVPVRLLPTVALHRDDTSVIAPLCHVVCMFICSVASPAKSTRAARRRGGSRASTGPPGRRASPT